MATEPIEGREALNLTLDARLVEKAKASGVDLDRAAERGIADAVRRAEAEAWREENREAIDSSNAYVERNGLPLAAYRMF